jgi:shikimate dehydrogenase
MDQYCVFGNPIEQSRSPFIHQEFAKQMQQTITYHKQYVELDNFPQAVNHFMSIGGKGANVTVPFKEQALQLCDQLSVAAKKAGAVNTLTFINGKIIGDNTDGLGLVQDLFRNQLTLQGSRILLLGAGGAAKGVLLPLLNENPTAIVIANRTINKAKQLCYQYNDERLHAYGFNEIPQQSFDLIINATSASLRGKYPVIPPQLIQANTVCYDMVYSKQLTPFLQWAKANGSETVVDGVGMLVAQAAASFNIWRHCLPQTAAVINKLKKSLMEEN